MAGLNKTKQQFLDQLVASGTMKAALLDGNHTTNIDTQEFFSDVSANEVSGTNYTSGGATLANVATSIDTGSDFADITSDDYTFTNITVADSSFVCYYFDTGTPTTSRLLNIEALTGAPIARTASDLAFVIGADGIAKVS